MAGTSPNTVMLSSRDFYTMSEGIVATATTIYPGMLVLFGAAGTLVPNNAAGDTDAPQVFAYENENFGEDLDTPYTDGDTCYIIYPRSGALVWGYLETAGNVIRGAALQSNGAGFLEAWVTPARLIGFAEESLNNTGGGTGPAGSARIRVRVA